MQLQSNPCPEYVSTSVGLCCWQVGHSTVDVSISDLMNGSPCSSAICNFYPCHHVHFDAEPWGKDRDDQRKWLGKECDTLASWLLRSSSSEVAEHSCKTWLFSHCVSFKWFIHIPLPQTSLSPVFQTFSIQYPEHQIELLATAQYTLFSVHLVPRAISTSRENKQLFVLLKVFYAGKIFLSHYPLRPPLSEAGGLKFSTFRQYLKCFKSGRTISKVVRSFLFFSQLVIENLWWGHISGLRKRRQFSRNSHRNLTCLCNLFLP